MEKEKLPSRFRHDCIKIQLNPGQVSRNPDAQYICPGEANRKQLQIFSV